LRDSEERSLTTAYIGLTGERSLLVWRGLALKHARKEKSLKELRIEAAQTSLTHARQRRGTSRYDREAIRLFERHLREVQAAKE
jgi:hypothetical protein